MKYLLLFISLILVSCSPSVSFMKYTNDNYPPTDKIEVLRNKPIDQNFIELGELSIRKSEDAILMIKNKAQEIGADAIIILGEVSKGTVIVPIGNILASKERKSIQAIAIRYTK